MFLKRLGSGIVLLAAAIALFYYGGLPLLLAFCIISVIGQRELYRAIGIEHKGLAAIGYVLTLIYYGLIMYDGVSYMMAMIVFSLLCFMTAYVVTFPEYKTEQVTGAFFGVCYVSVLMSFVYHTRAMNDGVYFVWLILFSAWGSDTLAYCAGRLFGNHKMAPVLSPKKTVEGAVGGVLGAAFLGFLYGLLLQSRFTSSSPQLVCSLACGVGAIISMIGDLAASAIKRNHGIKDFGNLIPGHGGILDRFDSMLFAAPAIYYAVILVQEFL